MQDKKDQEIKTRQKVIVEEVRSELAEEVKAAKATHKIAIQEITAETEELKASHI